MSELDGHWDVRRLSGALPPMTGIRKRIHGQRGETIVANGPRVPFDVRGLELRYRAPFAMVVDVLEPDGDGYRGRTNVFGRTIGEFELRRITVSDLNAQLVKHIDEAHAMEQNVLRMLDAMISTTDDPEILDRLEHHRMETKQHSDLMRQRLESHGAQPSMVRQAAGIVEALAKLPLDLVRGEKSGRNARDAFAAEHLEIASYELLRRVAEKAGDEETARAAAEIVLQEQAFADFISSNWDRFAELSLAEEGVAI